MQCKGIIVNFQDSFSMETSGKNYIIVHLLSPCECCFLGFKHNWGAVISLYPD